MAKFPAAGRRPRPGELARPRRGPAQASPKPTTHRRGPPARRPALPGPRAPPGSRPGPAAAGAASPHLRRGLRGPGRVRGGGRTRGSRCDATFPALNPGSAACAGAGRREAVPRRARPDCRCWPRAGLGRARFSVGAGASEREAVAGLRGERCSRAPRVGIEAGVGGRKTGRLRRASSLPCPEFLCQRPAAALPAAPVEVTRQCSVLGEEPGSSKESCGRFGCYQLFHLLSTTSSMNLTMKNDANTMILLIELETPSLREIECTY
ncbi:uncharacterized protein FN964_001134 [Alca torda]